jgi:catechol 2,3-dioxygenase
MKTKIPSIDPATSLGLVHLNVAKLSQSAKFYRETLGFEVVGERAARISLGAGGRELLRLSELKAGARHEHGAGLYHFCILCPDRLELARLLKRLMDRQTPLQGLVDHRMSEAIYLADPEGNGIELNWDRPRTEWPAFKDLYRLGNGPLDIEGLMKLVEQSGPGSAVLASNASIGHIHLHVAHLNECRDFYHGILGFEIMGEFPRQAVFTSAGGYHHHIAFNIWHGEGAKASPEGSLGMRNFTILSPNQTELDQILGRLKDAGIRVEKTEDGSLVQDPSSNGIILTTKS